MLQTIPGDVRAAILLLADTIESLGLDDPENEAQAEVRAAIETVRAAVPPTLLGKRVRVGRYMGRDADEALSFMRDPIDREDARAALGHVGTVTEDNGGGVVRVVPSCYPRAEAYFDPADLEVLAPEPAAS